MFSPHKNRNRVRWQMRWLISRGDHFTVDSESHPRIVCLTFTQCHISIISPYSWRDGEQLNFFKKREWRVEYYFVIGCCSCKDTFFFAFTLCLPSLKKIRSSCNCSVTDSVCRKACWQLQTVFFSSNPLYLFLKLPRILCTVREMECCVSILVKLEEKFFSISSWQRMIFAERLE